MRQVDTFLFHVVPTIKILMPNLPVAIRKREGPKEEFRITSVDTL